MTSSTSLDRVGCRLVGSVLLALVAGCTAAPPPSPELLARCTRDYGLWVRYNYSQAVIHTGQKMRADLALYRCQQGKYHPAIEELEDILTRSKVPLPQR